MCSAVAVLSPGGDALDPALDGGHSGVDSGVAGVGASYSVAHHSNLGIPDERRFDKNYFMIDSMKIFVIIAHKIFCYKVEKIFHDTSVENNCQ